MTATAKHVTTISHGYPGVMTQPTAVRQFGWGCSCGEQGPQWFTMQGEAERSAERHVAAASTTEETTE